MLIITVCPIICVPVKDLYMNDREKYLIAIHKSLNNNNEKWVNEICFLKQVSKFISKNCNLTMNECWRAITYKDGQKVWHVARRQLVVRLLAGIV